MVNKIIWDKPGERRFESGVDHGVLYRRNKTTGAYDKGYAWNGLTTVTESPSGAEASPQYADNIKYLNLISAEEFAATIEAFTYPDEFAYCDGTLEIAPGVQVGQQARETFGFHYRTKVGNDLVGQDAGYKLHLVYNALAAPTEKTNGTINDSPEANAFSWEVSTTAVEIGTIGGVLYRPTAHVTINSLTVDAADLAALEAILYGTAGTGTGGTTGAIDARMPFPAELVTLFGA
jgi:hypothetical protein